MSAEKASRGNGLHLRFKSRQQQEDHSPRIGELPNKKRLQTSPRITATTDIQQASGTILGSSNHNKVEPSKSTPKERRFGRSPGPGRRGSGRHNNEVKTTPPVRTMSTEKRRNSWNKFRPSSLRDLMSPDGTRPVSLDDEDDDMIDDWKQEDKEAQHRPMSMSNLPQYEEDYSTASSSDIRPASMGKLPTYSPSPERSPRKARKKKVALQDRDKNPVPRRNGSKQRRSSRSQSRHSNDSASPTSPTSKTSDRGRSSTPNGRRASNAPNTESFQSPPARPVQFDPRNLNLTPVAASTILESPSNPSLASSMDSHIMDPKYWNSKDASPLLTNGKNYTPQAALSIRHAVETTKNNIRNHDDQPTPISNEPKGTLDSAMSSEERKNGSKKSSPRSNSRKSKGKNGKGKNGATGPSIKSPTPSDDSMPSLSTMLTFEAASPSENGIKAPVAKELSDSIDSIGTFEDDPHSALQKKSAASIQASKSTEKNAIFTGANLTPAAKDADTVEVIIDATPSASRANMKKEKKSSLKNPKLTDVFQKKKPEMHNSYNSMDSSMGDSHVMNEFSAMANGKGARLYPVQEGPDTESEQESAPEKDNDDRKKRISFADSAGVVAQGVMTPNSSYENEPVTPKASGASRRMSPEAEILELKRKLVESQHLVEELQIEKIVLEREVVLQVSRAQLRLLEQRSNREKQLEKHFHTLRSERNAAIEECHNLRALFMESCPSCRAQFVDNHEYVMDNAVRQPVLTSPPQQQGSTNSAAFEWVNGKLDENHQERL